MGTLYLVRHGQASFGSDDYDRLSPLGHQQCERLGEWFRDQGIGFDVVLRGTLRRHEQSLQSIVDGFGDLPAPDVRPELDEYDSHAVLRTVHRGPLRPPASQEEYRAHFRLLREGLGRWMEGRAQPEGMPSFADFRAGLVRVLDAVRGGSSGNVLIVSSGGPIATAVSTVLDAPAPTAIELNMRIRNSAVTEFSFTPKRHVLHAFNTLPHIDARATPHWVTYT